MQFRLIFVVKAVPCLRQLVTDLSPRKVGFNPRSVNVRFLVKKKVPLGQVFLQVIRFPSVSIIPPMFHTHQLHVFITRRTNGRSLGTFQKAFPPGNRRALDRKVLHLFRLDMVNYTSSRNKFRFRSRLTALPRSMSIPIVPDHGCHAASYSDGTVFTSRLLQWPIGVNQV